MRKINAFIPPVIILFRPILVAQCCKTSIPILDKLTLDLAFRKSEMKFCNPLAWVDIFYNVQIQEQCLQYWVYCCWGLILWPKITGTEDVIRVLYGCSTVAVLRRAVTSKCLQRVSWHWVENASFVSGVTWRLPCWERLRAKKIKISNCEFSRASARRPINERTNWMRSCKLPNKHEATHWTQDLVLFTVAFMPTLSALSMERKT